MKVKCISTKRLSKEGEYYSLTVGKEYIVLAIEFYDKSKSAFSNELGDYIIYRLKDNEDLVIPYPSKLFDISSDKIPECWVTYKSGDGEYTLLPGSWARDSFWDDYYNDDPIALEEFAKAEGEIIIQA